MNTETRAVMLRLVEALEEIAKATDPESPDENYRADDREGCLDWVAGRAANAAAEARNLLDAQPAGKDAWLVEAERLAQLHACEKSLRHLGREDADETKTLAALLAHLRSHPAAPEGFVLVPVVPTKAMNQVMYDGDWTWPDMLAAAESITEDEYNTLNSMIAAAGKE